MDYQKRLQYFMRKKKVKNVYELSRLSGVPPTTIYSIIVVNERANSPRLDTLEKLCDGLGITLSEFFSDKKTPEEQILENLGLDENAIRYISENMHDENLFDAIAMWRSMPIKTKTFLRKILIELHEENL